MPFIPLVPDRLVWFYQWADPRFVSCTQTQAIGLTTANTTTTSTYCTVLTFLLLSIVGGNSTLLSPLTLHSSYFCLCILPHYLILFFETLHRLTCSQPIESELPALLYNRFYPAVYHLWLPVDYFRIPLKLSVDPRATGTLING